MYINTVNPVVYFVQNIHIYSPGKVGCLKTNEKSNIKSLTVILTGSGAVTLYLHQVLISGLFWLLVGKDG